MKAMCLFIIKGLGKRFELCPIDSGPQSDWVIRAYENVVLPPHIHP
jgi:hypothetical protein